MRLNGSLLSHGTSAHVKTVDEIRKMIAESGKLRIGEAVAYVMRRMPDADKKLVRAEAKEMIAEAKRFNNI
jgi:hypothetical protein